MYIENPREQKDSFLAFPRVMAPQGKFRERFRQEPEKMLNAMVGAVMKSPQHPIAVRLINQSRA